MTKDQEEAIARGDAALAKLGLLLRAAPAEALMLMDAIDALLDRVPVAASSEARAELDLVTRERDRLRAWVAFVTADEYADRVMAGEEVDITAQLATKARR